MTDMERLRAMAEGHLAQADYPAGSELRGYAEADAAVLLRAAAALEREEESRRAEPLYIGREGPMTLAGAPIESRVLVVSGWMLPAALARRLRATAQALEAQR